MFRAFLPLSADTMSDPLVDIIELGQPRLENGEAFVG